MTRRPTSPWLLPALLGSAAALGASALYTASRTREAERRTPPIGAFITGGVAGVVFVQMFQIATSRWKIDDVLGVWPLHGLCGLWGGIACGIFGLEALGGMGGVSFASQLVGSVAGAGFGFLAGTIVYRAVEIVAGFRLEPDAERRGADVSIHKISANPEEDVRLGRL